MTEIGNRRAKATDPTGPAGTNYVLPPVETSRASCELVDIMGRCFAGKNRHLPDDFLRSFSKDMVAYGDATLGWKIPDWTSLHQLLQHVMPNWGEGVSYPTRIVGNAESALVAVTDTPELFGGEIHALACVDIRDGEIVRWVDYWDSRHFAPALLKEMTADVPAYPHDLGEGAIGSGAHPLMLEIGTRLHGAIGSTDPALGDLLTYDVVFEDMARRVQLIGRTDVVQHLSRHDGDLPFGAGARLLHVVGGEAGGAYEWAGSAGSGVPRGVCALELDAAGRVSRITAAYDGARG